MSFTANHPRLPHARTVMHPNAQLPGVLKRLSSCCIRFQQGFFFFFAFQFCWSPTQRSISPTRLVDSGRLESNKCGFMAALPPVLAPTLMPSDYTSWVGGCDDRDDPVRAFLFISVAFHFYNLTVSLSPLPRKVEMCQPAFLCSSVCSEPLMAFLKILPKNEPKKPHYNLVRLQLLERI